MVACVVAAAQGLRDWCDRRRRRAARALAHSQQEVLQRLLSLAFAKNITYDMLVDSGLAMMVSDVSIWNRCDGL